MLEKTESLLPPRPSNAPPLQAICVGFEEDSLEELGRLLTTLDVRVIDQKLWRLRQIHPATYLGSGKVEELRSAIAALPPGADRLSADRSAAPAGGATDCIALDVELSPNQLRNLEKALGKTVLDRPGVILEIFSKHARTKEAKTQVELARLQYLLPRLTHFWTHFERQRGGIGLKGMGEKQIEVDRRLVKKRMALLKERLAAIGRERVVQRHARADLLKVALVGYTNAGKSTLLNGLTQSAVRAEDKLFATLDASVRALDPHSHPPIVMIDTVGFIKNLPPALVASFRSTLEELHEAHLLLHVVDASSPKAREQFEVTESILKDLGLQSKPRMTVLNKMDQLQSPAARNQARLAVPGAFRMSALNSEELEKLRELILKTFQQSLELWEIVVPYAESRIDSELHAYGTIERVRHLEKGTFYRLRMDSALARKLQLDRFRT